MQEWPETLRDYQDASKSIITLFPNKYYSIDINVEYIANLKLPSCEIS